MNKRVKSAAKLYEEFSGHRAGHTEKIDVPFDPVLTYVGICEAIAYNALRDGEVHSYQHEFEPHARPVLAVSSDGKRLYLLAGAYRFNDHGIVDEE